MNSAPVSTPLALYRLLMRNWWIKAPGEAFFIWGFFEAYFFLLRYPHAQVFTMPLTELDHAIPMQFWAWGPYLTLWFYTTLPPSLMPDLRQLIFYGLSVGACCLLGLTFFYFCPTVIPFIEHPAGATLALLEGVDAAGNACPSLHVAIAVFSALWLGHQLRAIGASAYWRLGNWVWCLAIAYSTLATKQHVVLDVLAGAVLGVVCAVVSLRVYRRFFRFSLPYGSR
jgi:membrane-associated phospholipid phosphatase